MSFSEEIERAEGVSGELVLRRGAAGLEVIANGVFLVSAANAASSRALVTAAWPHVPGDALHVLIGGLGIGDALDEALACERVASVTVAELEPVIVRWFREHGGDAARRAAEAERAGRARIVVDDVAGCSRSAGAGAWDVVALDTDNGPEWLVRGENAGLYAPAGLRRVRAALRPGGAAVFWSPERYPLFEGDLADVFDEVERVAAVDVIDGRPHEYTMYVARRGDGGSAACRGRLRRSAREAARRPGGLTWATLTTGCSACSRSASCCCPERSSRCTSSRSATRSSSASASRRASSASCWRTRTPSASAVPPRASPSSSRRRTTGRMNILVEGVRRFRIVEVLTPDDPEAEYLSAEVEYYRDAEPEGSETLREAVLEVYARMLVLMDVEDPEEPDGEGPLSFRIASTVDFGAPLKQELLESLSEEQRLETLLTVITSLLPRLELRKEREDAIRGNGKGY